MPKITETIAHQVFDELPEREKYQNLEIPTWVLELKSFICWNAGIEVEELIFFTYSFVIFTTWIDL